MRVVRRIGVDVVIFIPKAIRDEARSFARETVEQALKGLFGFIEHELARRRTAAFAHEKALEHEYLAKALPSVALIDLKRRVRRHLRLAARWSAKAYARDAVLAMACGLKCHEPGSAELV